MCQDVGVVDGGSDMGLDRLLADTRQALESIRGGAAVPDEPLEGTGTAHDDQVRATVRTPGRVTALDLNPRVMRLPSEELAEHIVTAVNAALDDLRAKAVDAATPVDLGTLGTQLADLQGESIRQMERF